MSLVLDVVLLCGLALVLLACTVLTVLQLPGTWLILAIVVAYDWHFDWTRFGPTVLACLAGAAALAEIAEMGSGFMFSRRAGMSRRASWYALIGGLLGALLLSVPVPIIGTVIGAVIGCFAGAMMAEMEQGRGMTAGARSGYYSALGRAVGSVLKILAAVVMTGVSLSLATVQIIRSSVGG